MFEVRQSQAWNSPTSLVLPTANLTASEIKKIAEREVIIDAVRATKLNDMVHIKLNTGIFKGTIFEVKFSNSNRWHVSAIVDQPDRRGWRLNDFIGDKDPAKDWQFAKRRIAHRTYPGREPIRIGNDVIQGEFVGGEHATQASILFGYEGDPVFCIDKKKRPPTFTDRLDQEVGVGDLVVVALNYGAGLDICVIKGFADERRVLIESMQSGSLDRIPLEKNATAKIMKMPNSLRDTALMMKLSRN